MKEIYLLYSCDAWKHNATMDLIMGSTSVTKIKAEIKRQLKSKKMEYESDKDHLKTYKLEEIQKCLKYGHIDIIHDGEKQ